MRISQAHGNTADAIVQAEAAAALARSFRFLAKLLTRN